MYTSEADFHKPGIYGGSVRVWAIAWDVFRRAPSRVGRGRRAAVDFAVCFGLGGFFSSLFLVFISSNPHGLIQGRGHFASCTSLLVILIVIPQRCLLFRLFACHRHPSPVCDQLPAFLGHSSSTTTTTTTATATDVTKRVWTTSTVCVCGCVQESHPFARLFVCWG